MNNKYSRYGVLIIIFLLFESCLITSMAENTVNPSIINNYRPLFANGSNLTYEYVIITDEKFENSNFQLLINHKSQYVNATIFTKEDILSNSSFWVNGTYGDSTNTSNGNPWIKDGEEVIANYYRFNDTAAKIRNFIRYAHQEWKTKYVLLGGDVEIIPVRNLYVNISGWDGGMLFNRSIEGWIPSDLYYGALNGTWNRDFDEKFGEKGDSIKEDEADLYAEVYIGRAPVDGKHDIATFVKKVMHFETTNKPNDILLHQSNLRPSNKPDTSVIPEACAKLIPDSYNIHKMYQKNGIITKDDWLNSFREPSKLLLLHIGNGYHFGPSNSWYQLYYNILGRGKFTNFDIVQLSNEFYPIHISISCLSGNFIFTDCLAEELLLWPGGGPSACFFNSEMGCVKTEDILSYSGEFIERLFYEFFTNETENLGKINQFAKEYFIDNVYLDPNYRWVYYETNLLGDPETPVFETREKLPTPMVYVNNDFDNSTPGWNVTHFNRIQNGINASFENGIVYVYNGTYFENIVIDKTVDIVGESKYSTIIDGGDIDNVVTAITNSSVIKNLTIQHSNSGKNRQNQTGIYIPKECWGNEISNCIVIGNEKCGIYINGNCRNSIHGNIISSNGYGICIINKINGLREKNIVLTCGNTIKNNEISFNDNLGVYIQANLNNVISNNNFINNSVESGRFPKLIRDAYFLLSRNNIWEGNYWNEPRTNPKLIWGIRGPFILRIPDFSDGLIFPKTKYLGIINIGFPIPAIDRDPAEKPYDIQ